MAWPDKTSSGKWRYGYRDRNGRKQYTPVYERQRDARDDAQEKELVERRAARKKGKLPLSTTYGELWDLIKDSRVFPESDSGVTEAAHMNRYCLPQWEDHVVRKIEQKEVQDWVNSLAAGTCEQWTHDRRPSAHYVARVFGTFRVTMNIAMHQEGLISVSPCSGIKLPHVSKNKEKPWMPTDDVEKLRPYLTQDMQDAVDLGMETGCRPGELCGVHFTAVQTKRRRIRISDVMVERQGVIRPHPKDRDERFVPLTKRAEEIIERRKTGRKGCGAPHTDGSECTSDLILRFENGEPMTSRKIRRRMQAAAKKAGLPLRGGYSLRRGMITRAIDGGADPFALQRITGHADLDELAGYVQDSPEAMARILAALGEVPELRAVVDDLRRGAQSGAKPGREAPDDTGRDSEEDAG